MKKSPFLLLIVLTLLSEIILCFFIIRSIRDDGQDTVVINECLKSVGENFGDSDRYIKTLPYTVIDTEGTVLFLCTGDGSGKDAVLVNASDLSKSVNEAVHNNDTILDIQEDGEVIGKILFHNGTAIRTSRAKKSLMQVLILFSALQLILVFAFYAYLKHTIIKPFSKLNDFAVRIAGGNLDIPLTVDKKHVFGSFTEAFDLMRSELKKAQMAEKKANDEKKETIAKLSHDIKTPVASIKSSSEIGYELAGDEKSREYFHLINEKADQIKTLTDNLFTSSVQEVTQIAVTPGKQPSDVVETLLKNADYLHKAVTDANTEKADVYAVPKCEVTVDKLRLQQVFDNLFMNSYKYADTDITLNATLSEEYLVVEIADNGPGVKAEELPLIKEKYRRGVNASDKDGAGLGLYLSEYFLNEMGGMLEIESSEGAGFLARVYLRRDLRNI